MKKIPEKCEILRCYPVFNQRGLFSHTRTTGGFQVNNILPRWLINYKRRMDRRLDKTNVRGCSQPMFTASNIHYDVSQRCHGLAYGGLGAIHLLARQLGLPEAIDQSLHLLVIHLPYHESDHVLNMAYLPICGGTCLQDLEILRNDEHYLDALGARRIPDPTTAGDFCRRFNRDHLSTLMDVIDEARLHVWAYQPRDFFARAILDMDGSLVATTGQCKQGMDIAYDGTWGYHPLILTLANTNEVLRLINRSGNRPSHEGAAAEVDQALDLCFRGGFRQVLLRGDTDFSQTEHLDRWDADPRIRFLFGYDAMPNLEAIAEDLPAPSWQPLERPTPYEVKTQPRCRPDNVKEDIVIKREYENQRLQGEMVAEFSYQPTACGKAYRMVVLRKNISVHKGEKLLFDNVRYFFFITNDYSLSAAEVVLLANERCNQENVLSQLHSGVCALSAPLDSLESNWAYMLMTALGWNLKAWWALMLPVASGRWQEKHSKEKQWVLGMEFKTFVNAFVRIPCQVIRTGRKLIYRLLGGNPYLSIFFRLLGALRC